jgi:hypothetical protein
MASVRGVSEREGRDPHGVRGGSPPKGGEPHHPHGRASNGPAIAPPPSAAPLSSAPLDQVRALRSDLHALDLADIDRRLGSIEQSLQRRLSVQEAAALLGETPGNVYKAVKRGNLPAKFEGARNSPSFTVAELEAWRTRPRRCARAA